MADEALVGRRFARRRRANVAGGRQHAHQVLVTPEEEARLVQLAAAAKVTVPRLLVESALSPQGETSTTRRDMLVELFAVHRLLAAVSNNLNQIAKATNATGQVQPGTAGTVQALRRVAERIDAAIDELGERR